MANITFDPQDMGAETGRFKAACVRAENAATPFARKALAGLLTGGATVSSLTLLVLAAFGNPKSPKGKPLDKLTGSGDHVPGFGAARKACATIFRIYDDSKLDDSVRAVVVDFVLEREGSPKSLNALAKAVAAAVKAFNESQGAADAASNADDTTPEENAPSVASEPRPDIAAMASDMVKALEAASIDELDAAGEALSLLMLAIAEASKRSETERLQQAA